jgi:hypothetical protein
VLSVRLGSAATRRAGSMLQAGDHGQAPKTACAWHALNVDADIAELQTEPGGLSEPEARRRLETYGPKWRPGEPL